MLIEGGGGRVDLRGIDLLERREENYREKSPPVPEVARSDRIDRGGRHGEPDRKGRCRGGQADSTRPDTKSSGVGMGLSICRSIIDTNRGRLWADANEPRGTYFSSPCPERSLCGKATQLTQPLLSPCLMATG